MTVSISNMNQAWLDANAHTAISMNVSTMGYAANTDSRLLSLGVDGNTSYSIDTSGVTYNRANTVASLPPVALGARGFVTDANSTTFNTRAFGGGSNAVPVFSNGTYWLIG